MSTLHPNAGWEQTDMQGGRKWHVGEEKWRERWGQNGILPRAVEHLQKIVTCKTSSQDFLGKSYFYFILFLKTARKALYGSELLFSGGNCCGQNLSDQDYKHKLWWGLGCHCHCYTYVLQTVQNITANTDMMHNLLIGCRTARWEAIPRWFESGISYSSRGQQDSLCTICKHYRTISYIWISHPRITGKRRGC